MIKYRFLYFKTLTDFQSKLSEIDRQSIVFIQDKHLIWTHGQYYGAVSGDITIDGNILNLIEQLTERITDLENNHSGSTIISEDGTKHIFTTLEEYQALQNYQDNAIYFILEPEAKTNWTFGGTFPVVLAGE